MKRLNSLLLVEERLLEAEYFADRFRWLRADEFGYEFNAFLSAARSVTFLLQKEMKEVAGFDVWWDARRGGDEGGFCHEILSKSEKFLAETRAHIHGGDNLP